MRKKTKRAEKVLDRLIEALTDDHVYKKYRFKSLDEIHMQQALDGVLRRGIKDYYKHNGRGYRENTLDRKARRALTWEGDQQSSISGTKLFALSHRPDFVVEMEGLRIAIEIKSDDSGSGIREGIGQALVYATDHDFVIYLMIDTSRNHAIVDSVNNDPEKSLIEKLWLSHNIRMVLAPRKT